MLMGGAASGAVVASGQQWFSLMVTLTLSTSSLYPGSQITEGVKPTLSELEKFEDQPEGIDLEVVTEGTGIWSWPCAWLRRRVALEVAAQSTLHCSSGKEREHNFQPGDNVEVCEGELINLQGKVLSVDGNKITIMPKHEDLKVTLSGHAWQAVCRPRQWFLSLDCLVSTCADVLLRGFRPIFCLVVSPA